MPFPKAVRCNALETYFYLEVVSCYLSDQVRFYWQESHALISTFEFQATLYPSNVSKAIVFRELLRHRTSGQDRRWAWNGFFTRVSKPLASLEVNEVGSIYLFFCTGEREEKGYTFQCTSQLFQTLGWATGPHQSGLKQNNSSLKKSSSVAFAFFFLELQFVQAEL